MNSGSVGGGGGGGGGGGAYIFACVDNGVTRRRRDSMARGARGFPRDPRVDGVAVGRSARRVEGRRRAAATPRRRGLVKTPSTRRFDERTRAPDVVGIHKAFGGIPLVRAPRRVLVGLSSCLGVPDLRLVVTQAEVALSFEHFGRDRAGRRLTRKNPQQRIGSTFRAADAQHVPNSTPLMVLLDQNTVPQAVRYHSFLGSDGVAELLASTLLPPRPPGLLPILVRYRFLGELRLVQVQSAGPAWRGAWTLCRGDGVDAASRRWRWRGRGVAATAWAQYQQTRRRAGTRASQLIQEPPSYHKERPISVKP